MNNTFLNRNGKIVIFGILGLIVFVGLTIFIAEKRNYVWTNDAFLEGYGIDLSSNVTEKIMTLYVDEGMHVRKGDKIASLQDNVPLARKKEAEAHIFSMEREVSVKEALFLKWKSDYRRAVEGIGDHIISVQDYEHVERDFQMSVAEWELAKANLELAKKKLEVIRAELTHYEIAAPQDGIIAKRWVWTGDVVQPGQSLFTLYDPDNMWVLANLEEKKIRKVKLGDSVKIHIDAYPGYTFSGKVFTIKNAAASLFTLVPQNTATGNYTKVEQRIPVKISVKRPDDFPENQPLYLFPGMSTEVHIRVR